MDLSHIEDIDEIDPANRALVVIKHLVQRGHISQGTATLEYGSLLQRLSDVIHRLRNEDADMVPPGHHILTVKKFDTQGRPYGEYHLTRGAA